MNEQVQEMLPRFSPARTTEAVIIAIIVAVLSSFGSASLTIASLRVELDALRTQVSELKGDVKDMRGVVYQPRWESSRLPRTGPAGEAPDDSQ